MGKFLYNLGVCSYGIVVRLAASFNSKAAAWAAGRKDWKNKLSIAVETFKKDKPVVWFHVSSLGEFEQGRPLMETLKKESKVNLVLTFFSPSGYEVMKKWKTADLICYLPIDSDKNAADFIELIKPDIAVFVKYDFWYHYLNHLNKKQIKTFVISARFYAGQLFFKPWAKWYRKMLFLIDKIYVQDKVSAELLNGIGYDSYEIAGDTRYDRVLELGKNTDTFPEIEFFVNGEKVFIAGSSWPSDEALICKYINQYPDNFKYLIAPHDISENHLSRIENQLKVPFKRYSAFSESEPVRVLILDTIGILGRVYKYATVAYIGGAFKEGLHNILEPATYGVPVITGPNHDGFPEGPEMEKAGALVRVKDYEAFEILMNRLLENETRLKMSEASKRFIQTRKGATENISDHLKKIISGLSQNKQENKI